jgi:DNA-binding IclR family transcriptional regulator
MTHPTKLEALQVLFRLARDGRAAQLRLVAHELGSSCAQADRLLAELGRRGLVDAERIRLTMAGLVLAASHRSERARRPQRWEPCTRAAA